jgi:rubrerythrin
MKYKTCSICNKKWNVSVQNKSKPYVCPICEERLNKYGNTPKVLLKNKSKFNAL